MLNSDKNNNFPKILFVGGGKMATALIEGFIKSGAVQCDQIFVIVRNMNSAKNLQNVGCIIGTDYSVVENADIIFCAVNPNDVSNVLSDIKKYWDDSKLFVSLCAGIPLSFFSILGFQASIIRLMPNISCMIQSSASVYCFTRCTKYHLLNAFENLLRACGEIYEVDESLMNAATGLNGCGIAYIYMVIESLSDAGVKNGLPRDLATKLAAQTVYGGASMVKTTGLQPAVLKEQITTSGGATIAAIATLEEKGLRHALISAVDCATKKTEEIEKKFCP